LRTLHRVLPYKGLSGAEEEIVKKQFAAPPPQPGLRSAGQQVRFGRYQLNESLGVGGMAELFKATCSGPGGFERTVVIKRILPASSADPQFVRMFIAEAKILGMLNHPNIVQAYDFGEVEGRLFLVLEYIDGPSLLSAMQAMRNAGGHIPVAIAAHFAQEICRALDYVHNLADSDGKLLSVVHRDVTPSNIVLTSAGALKLLDFGVARYSTSAAHCDEGGIKGKVAYLAPEALKGLPIDRRVDIFSLGVVLHEMLTLKELFASKSTTTTLNKVLEAKIPLPSQARPDVPPELDAIVMMALERDPERRYANAADMAHDLNEFVIASRMHAVQVIEFAKDVLAELAKCRGIVPAGLDSSIQLTAALDGCATERDLGLRFRMSRVGRFFSERRGDGH
jgi:eukaryotic-like serine/threonine-protein kinase